MKCKKCKRELGEVNASGMDHWYFYCPHCGHLHLGMTLPSKQSEDLLDFEDYDESINPHWEELDE